MSTSRKIALLGGAGFLGSQLLPDLLANGHDVRVFTREDSDLSRLKEYVDDIELHLGDFANELAVRQAVQGCDQVVHMISSTVAANHVNSLRFDLNSNLVPTLALAESCVELGVERITFLSSGGTVYGEPRNLPIGEDHPRRPVSEYGLGKKMIEDVLQHVSRKHDINTTILRLSNPYGVGQRSVGLQGIVAVALGRALDGTPFTLRGDGTTTRDYQYIDDAVRGIASAMDWSDGDLTLNISSGIGVSTNEILELVEKTTGRELLIEKVPSSDNDVAANVLDNSLANKLLEWKPTIPLSEGFERTWQWMNRAEA